MNKVKTAAFLTPEGYEAAETSFKVEQGARNRSV
jgi:hypothetical protein